MNKFPRYTICSIQTVIVSLVARAVLPVLYILPIFITRAAGKSLFHNLPLSLFMVYITFKFAVFLCGFWLIFRSTNNLCYYRFPEVKWLRKIMIVGSNVVLPWLEIWHLLSFDRTAIFLVPRLWQKDPSEKWKASLFLSVICFLEGIPKLNAKKIVGFLKDKYFCYFVENQRDSHEIQLVVSLNEGQLYVRISIQRLYMFIIPDSPVENFTKTEGWEISEGSEETALVFDKQLSPAWTSEKTICEDIIEAINVLKGRKI